MWRSAKLVMASSIVVLVAAGSVWAQAQMPMPAPPMAPAQPASPAAGSLEGKVKQVDLTAGTVRVSTGWFGLVGKTLSVTGDTQVTPFNLVGTGGTWDLTGTGESIQYACYAYAASGLATPRGQ